MSLHPKRFLLVVWLACAPACNGNIGDLFSLFPASAFAPDPDGEGGGGTPGTFTPREVAFLQEAQGVTGNVRNIALATVASQTIAFLSAGVDGVHMVNATVPESMNASSYITTIDNSVLSSAAAEIAGGRVDEVAVVDNSFLVCLAVGSGSPNAVTVFHIPTLVELAVSETADLSGAFVPGTGAIAVDGTPGGNAGGVSGANGLFAVATGGAQLGLGSLSATPLPGTWSALPPVTSTTPRIDRFLKVVFNFPVAYATVAVADDVRLATLAVTISPPGIGVTGELDPVTGAFSVMDDNNGSEPGTFVANPALDGASRLFVSGQNDIRVFSLASAQDPLESTTVFNAGLSIGGVAATTGLVAVGDGATVRVTALISGVTSPVAAVQSTGRRYFDMAFRSSAAGRFVLACANDRGLRVIQFSDIP